MKEQEASLFGLDDEVINSGSRPVIEPAMPWADIIKLDKERELVGMYLSAHPLDKYYMELTYGVDLTLKDFNELSPVEGMEVTFGGMVIESEERLTSTGNKMKKFKIEDFTGTTELVMFGRQIIELGNYCNDGTPIMVSGKYAKGYKGDIRFNITNIKLLDDIKDKVITGITIHAATDQLDELLQSVLNESINVEGMTKGLLNFRIFDSATNRVLPMTSDLRIHIDRKLLDTLSGMDLEFAIDHVKA
jgi:DNA polymerase-3 subunit alpha